MKQGTQRRIRRSAPPVCTCDPDDFGMGHGAGCPVGDQNGRQTVRDAIREMKAHGVPEPLLRPVRRWLLTQEKKARR
jgi:hypothetical protein